MKKLLTTTAIALTLLTINPKPAKAITSVFMGGVPLAIGGAVLLGSAQIGALGVNCLIGIDFCFSGPLILVGGLLGVVMLDQDGEVSLTELSVNQAEKIGVSENSRVEFNNSRVALTQVANEINTVSTTPDDAKSEWKANIGDTVSQEAFDVYVKVIAAELKK